MSLLRRFVLAGFASFLIANALRLSAQQDGMRLFVPQQELSPISAEACEDISKKASAQAASFERAHQACLDNAERAHVKPQPTPVPTVCSQAGCQQLHELRRTAESYARLADRYATECHEAWNKKQEELRKAEAEANRRAEEQEQERQRRQREAAKLQAQRERDMQQVQKQQEHEREKDERAQREAARKQAEDERQRRAEADAVASRFAAEGSAREQQALAQRTAERQQQLDAVERSASQAAAEQAARSGRAEQEIAAMDSRLLTSNSNPFGTAGQTDSGANEYDFGGTAAPAGTTLSALGAAVASHMTQEAVAQVKAGLREWVEDFAGESGTALLEHGQAAYDHYVQIRDAAAIWTRIMGDDRRDSIDALGEGAGMVADHAFTNSVQQWLVKQNATIITGAANNTMDVLDGAFARVDGGNVDPATAAMMDDPSLILPGMATFRNWNSRLNTTYERFKKLLSTSN